LNPPTGSGTHGYENLLNFPLPNMIERGAKAVIMKVGIPFSLADFAHVAMFALFATAAAELGFMITSYLSHISCIWMPVGVDIK